MAHFDLCIVGTGSGNSILDERFDDWTVAIVEQGTFGGTCLNVGCIPTKMFVHTADVAHAPEEGRRLGIYETLDEVDWPAVRDRIFGRIDPIAAGGRRYRTEDSPNVTVFEGRAHFTGPRRLEVALHDGSTAEIDADQIVLATGGRPVIPEVPGLSEVPYLTSDTVMRLERLPRRLAIWGGGYIAAEFAHVFGAFGVDVTIVCRSQGLLRAEDEDVSRRFTEIALERWDVRLQRQLCQVRRGPGGAIELELQAGDASEHLGVDALLIATGRRPNGDTLRLEAGGVAADPEGKIRVDGHQHTSAPGVWALGDASSDHLLKHVANHEMRIVRHNLLHPDEMLESDHRFVPHAVFSSPQVASVGLSERAAKEAGIDYVTSHQDYSGIAFGWALEDTSGFCKLLADPRTGLLLGAHIIGFDASSLLQPLIQAMHFGLTAPRMAREQYWIHPALPELLENALLALPLGS